MTSPVSTQQREGVDVVAVLDECVSCIASVTETEDDVAFAEQIRATRAAVAELIAAAQQQQAALLTGFGGISTAEHDADCRLRRALIACGVKS